MELKLEHGDYSPDGLGGMTRLDGADGMLQRIHYRLMARRGVFPFLPKMGSELYRLMAEKPSARQGVAERYVREALEEEEDVIVETVTLGQSGDRLTLAVTVSWQGESLTVAETL